MYRELLADSDTPVSAYAARGAGEHSFLLESVVFALIGLQLRVILGALSYSLGEAAWYALVILATVIYASFFVVAANALVDMLYAVIDPRVRA